MTATETTATIAEITYTNTVTEDGIAYTYRHTYRFTDDDRVQQHTTKNGQRIGGFSDSAKHYPEILRDALDQTEFPQVELHETSTDSEIIAEAIRLNLRYVRPGMHWHRIRKMIAGEAWALAYRLGGRTIEASDRGELIRAAALELLGNRTPSDRNRYGSTPDHLRHILRNL